MTGWLIFLACAASWFVAAVAGTRFVMRISRCHAEPRIGTAYNWGLDRGYCQKWDRAECWRPNTAPSLADTLIGSAAALVWPIALPILAVRHFAATTAVSPHLMSEADLDRLERDLGIGGEQR